MNERVIRNKIVSSCLEIRLGTSRILDLLNQAPSGKPVDRIEDLATLIGEVEGWAVEAFDAICDLAIAQHNVEARPIMSDQQKATVQP